MESGNAKMIAAHGMVEARKKALKTQARITSGEILTCKICKKPYKQIDNNRVACKGAPGRPKLGFHEPMGDAACC